MGINLKIKDMKNAVITTAQKSIMQEMASWFITKYGAEAMSMLQADFQGCMNQYKEAQDAFYARLNTAEGCKFMAGVVHAQVNNAI